MRFITTVLATLVLAFLLWMLVAGILSYWDVQAVPGAAVPDAWSGPDSWSEWRDIVIVMSFFFFLLAGILSVALMVVLLIVASLLRKVLRDNAGPALDSLRQSLDNVRGTTEFAGETIAAPILRVYSVFHGVRSGLGAVSGIGDRIKGRKKKGRR